jgi:hypothetical protein
MSKEEKKWRRDEQNNARNKARWLDIINEQKNQSPVKEITITVEWRRNRRWGFNPHATAQVRYHNGMSAMSDGFTCSGCGYDKASTVVAEVFNKYLLYKIWNKPLRQCQRSDNWQKKRKAPYGIVRTSIKKDWGIMEYCSFSGGIGISCYFDIAKWMGGEFKTIAFGNTFDVYQYIDKVRKPKKGDK